MSSFGRTIVVYGIITILTLLVVELGAFSALVWRSMAAETLGLADAVLIRLAQYPLLDRRVRLAKRDSEYQFLPTTQHAFRASTSFSGLRVGRHGFILNSAEETADYPDKVPGTTRIVILGGSSAAGATASGNDKTIAAQLEALLNAGSSSRFQVLNFGMGGNYSYGELAKLVTEVAYIDADVVIMFDGFNDAHYANLEHLRAGLPAPLLNWADYSYQYFDTMNGLRGQLRGPPPIMTYSWLLVNELAGTANTRSLRKQRQAIYAGLPARALSDWVATKDPGLGSALQTNIDIAASWVARKGNWFFGYLQPHPWEYKDLACERTANTRLMVGRLGPAVDEASYAKIMQRAFQNYAGAYQSLDIAYSDEKRVRFIDLRRLFEHVDDCIYNDPIHYNDTGNLLIARRMLADLQAAGLTAARD